jgi:hypothetical protein
VSIAEDKAAFCVSAQPLHGVFRKRGSKGHDNPTDSKNAKQGENPVRDILHQDAYTVALVNASRFKIGGNAIRKPKNVRVGVFLKPIRVVENECGALWTLLRPLVDLIEDPTAAYR